MVRAALALGDRDLAARLRAGFEPRNPYAEHALFASGAALTEAQGDLEAACDAYAEAARRWERFEVSREQAYALLGQGRCLLALGRPADAAVALREGRRIFAALGTAPALAESDRLLAGAPSAT